VAGTAEPSGRAEPVEAAADLLADQVAKDDGQDGPEGPHAGPPSGRSLPGRSELGRTYWVSAAILGGRPGHLAGLSRMADARTGSRQGTGDSCDSDRAELGSPAGCVGSTHGDSLPHDRPDGCWLPRRRRLHPCQPHHLPPRPRGHGRALGPSAWSQSWPPPSSPPGSSAPAPPMPQRRGTGTRSSSTTCGRTAPPSSCPRSSTAASGPPPPRPNPAPESSSSLRCRRRCGTRRGGACCTSRRPRRRGLRQDNRQCRFAVRCCPSPEPDTEASVRDEVKTR
jgi:hypothetical protein